MIKKNIYNRIITGSILFFLAIIMFKSKFFSVYMLILFGVISIIEFLNLSKKIFTKKIIRLVLNTIFIGYISFFCYFFFFSLNFPFLKYTVFILLLGCIASDIGGFIFGKTFKGPRLTKISPNKTYSGALGSIFFSCLVISILILLSSNTISYSILLISVFTSIGCQLGDLFFSFLKRKAKTKDTGKILPGHGGILDRIDGVLLGVPVGMIFIIILS